MLNFRTANLILIVAISEIRSCFGLALGDSKEFCDGNELLSEIQSKLMPLKLWPNLYSKTRDSKRMKTLCNVENNGYIRVRKSHINEKCPCPTSSGLALDLIFRGRITRHYCVVSRNGHSAIFHLIKDSAKHIRSNSKQMKEIQCRILKVTGIRTSRKQSRRSKKYCRS